MVALDGGGIMAPIATMMAFLVDRPWRALLWGGPCVLRFSGGAYALIAVNQSSVHLFCVCVRRSPSATHILAPQFRPCSALRVCALFWVRSVSSHDVQPNQPKTQPGRARLPCALPFLRSAVKPRHSVAMWYCGYD